MIEMAIAFVGLKALAAIGLLSTGVSVDKEIENEKKRTAEKAFNEGVGEGRVQQWEDEAADPLMNLAKKEYQLVYLNMRLQRIEEELEEARREAGQ